MLNVPVPLQLRRDTIYECVFEVRFGLGHPAAEELMPGMLFGPLGRYFKRLMAQPISQIPKPARNLDPNLIYQPTYALEADDMRMLVGGRVAAVSFPKPYPGWAVVQPRILECMEALLNTQLVGNIERLSLKYTNLLNAGRDENDLKQLQVEIKLNGFSCRGPGLAIRAEIDRNECITAVNIMAGTQISVKTLNQETKDYGVLLDVDTIKQGPFTSFKNNLPALLDTLHTTEKEIFFGLLTPETLNMLSPVWQQH